MNLIGGELALKSLDENIFFTDSGRSSLRLFIRSGNQNKKFLIPDFQCDVIEDILIQEQVNYEFYNILDNLDIDWVSVIEKDFDVFYIINYFGKKNHTVNLNIKEKIIIEDNVFFYAFENHNNYKNWFAFNSFRKVSSLVDGSMIKTNLNINKNLIIKNEADFVKTKNKAKNIKYNYLNKTIGQEDDYIKLFENGETILDQQRDIFNISTNSIYQLMQFNVEHEQNISKRYYDFLFKQFESNCLNKEVEYYSFFIMKVSKRDELRKFLFSKNIYLPIHWLNKYKSNQLCDNIISIPIFSQYTFDDMKYVSSSIREFYEKH